MPDLDATRPSESLLAAPPLDARDLRIAAEDAQLAMERYAELLLAWNAPDDEHTEFLLRHVSQDAYNHALTLRGDRG